MWWVTCAKFGDLAQLAPVGDTWIELTEIMRQKKHLTFAQG